MGLGGFTVPWLTTCDVLIFESAVPSVAPLLISQAQG